MQASQSWYVTLPLPAVHSTCAALADVSQPPEEPGRLSQILSKVEQAKQEVAAERQQQAEEQSSQEQVGGSKRQEAAKLGW